MKPSLGVIGGGDIGLAVGVSFARQGYSVILVETSPEQYHQLTLGPITFQDPLLAQAFNNAIENGRLRVTKEIAELKRASYIFCCVELPQGANGEFDSSSLWKAAQEAAPYLINTSCFIVKSTTPVGTSDLLQEWFDQRGQEVEVIAYPEFPEEGSSLDEVCTQSRIILGGDPSKPGIHSLRKLLAQQSLPILVTTRRNAELARFAASTFQATKLSFINQIAGLCEKMNADVQVIARAIGIDPRIGQAFLTAGIGYGGPYLPKDLDSLLYQGLKLGVKTPLLEAVKQVNVQQSEWIWQEVTQRWGSMRKITLAIWGISDKGGSRDIPSSAALLIIRNLLGQQATLRIYDPFAVPYVQKIWQKDGILALFEEQICWCEDALETALEADGLIILTDWQEFREVDLGRLKERLAAPVVIDGRNLFPQELMQGWGFEYVSVGRKIRT